MRQQSRRINWFRLLVIGIFGYFLYVCFGQQSQLSAIQQERDAIRQKIEQSRLDNVALTEERNQLNDRTYIEKLAREELGMTKPGETPFVPAAKK